MPLNGTFFPRLTAAAGCDQLSNFQWSLAISRWFDIDRHPLSPSPPPSPTRHSHDSYQRLTYIRFRCCLYTCRVLAFPLYCGFVRATPCYFACKCSIQWMFIVQIDVDYCSDSDHNIERQTSFHSLEWFPLIFWLKSRREFQSIWVSFNINVLKKWSIFESILHLQSKFVCLNLIQCFSTI